MTLRDVDFITELLPCYLKVEWRRRYRDIAASEKIHPFMHFLEGEREAVSPIAEYQPKGRRNEFPKYERKKQHVQGYHAGKQSSKNHLTERTVSVIPHQNAKSFRNYRLEGKKESMNF